MVLWQFPAAKNVDLRLYRNSRSLFQPVYIDTIVGSEVRIGTVCKATSFLVRIKASNR
jgi:hypothetical protein